MIVQRRIQLVDLMKELNIMGPVAEIGVAEGNFSRDLLVAGVPFVYMVDNWAQILNVTGDGNNPSKWHRQNYYDALAKTQPYADRRKVLKGMSVDMADHVPDYTLSMVYLDADHSYKSVFNDLDAWFNKVINGGIIAGHDYLNPAYGVNRAVNDFVSCYKNEMVVHTIAENSPADASFYFIKIPQ